MFCACCSKVPHTPGLADNTATELASPRRATTAARPTWLEAPRQHTKEQQPWAPWKEPLASASRLPRSCKVNVTTSQNKMHCRAARARKNTAQPQGCCHSCPLGSSVATVCKEHICRPRGCSAPAKTKVNDKAFIVETEQQQINTNLLGFRRKCITTKHPSSKTSGTTTCCSWSSPCVQPRFSPLNFFRDKTLQLAC